MTDIFILLSNNLGIDEYAKYTLKCIRSAASLYNNVESHDHTGVGELEKLFKDLKCDVTVLRETTRSMKRVTTVHRRTDTLP